MKLKRLWIPLTVGLALVSVFLAGARLGLAESPTSQAEAAGRLEESASNPLAHFSGSLAPGEQIHTDVFLPGGKNQTFNLKLSVPDVSGDGSLHINIVDSNGDDIFTGSILDGEILWSILTLRPKENTLTLSNPSDKTLNFEIWVYTVGDPPLDWGGISRGSGTWRPSIRLNFPSAGVYRFDYGITSGRYQFLVDQNYIQKTVENRGVVQYYLSAGLHDLRIEPDPTISETSWTLSISGPVAQADSLPYTQTGGSLGGVGNPFDQEWMPFNLPGVSIAHFSLTPSGTISDGMSASLYLSYQPTPIFTTPLVHGGETYIWTSDLENGVNRLHLQTSPQNHEPMQYQLSILAPIAHAGGPYHVGEGSLLTLNGSGSDPTGIYGPLEYAWDMDGNGSFETNGADPIFDATLLDGPATFTVTLKVQDAGGGVATDRATIYVDNVPPTASLSNDGPVDEGGRASVTFASPFDPSSADTAAGFNYSYDFDNNGTFEITDSLTTSISLPANLTSDGPAVRTVRARIADKDGGFTDYTSDITVNNVAPTASLSNSGPVDEGSAASVSFNNPFDPSPPDTAAGFSYSYDFDNDGTFEIAGSSQATVTVPVSYTADGPMVRTVRARIADKDGGFTDYTTAITVNNRPPALANLQITPSINENDLATLRGTIRDPGTPDTFTLQVNWGDGSTPETFNYPAGTTSFSLSHRYLDDNPSGTSSDTYTISLVLSDDDGGSVSASLPITVNNVPPLVNAGSNQTVSEGDPVTFQGSFSDPGTLDTHTILWDFGDGTSASGTLTPTHTYPDNGVFSVVLTVSDDDGGIGKGVLQVTVNNVAPAPAVGADVNLKEGSTFSRQGSFTDPGADTWTATVDYGDGTGLQPLALNGKIFNLNHIYADNGKYTLIVTVTDDDGGSGSASLIVTVENVAPIVNAGPDQAAFSGKPVHFLGSFQDPGTLDTHTILWDFGDGQPTVFGSLAVEHTYINPGVYTATLTVTDKDGGVGQDSLIVNVTLPYYAMYIPLLYKPDLPDLVGSFSLNPDKRTFTYGEPVTITVVITNQGSIPASGFWVDFYINPSRPPTAANMTWDSLCSVSPCYGVSWYVMELGPGSSLTLTSTPGSYEPAYTAWKGYFPSYTTDLYLYVDSYDPSSPDGSVNESNEANNRAELHNLRIIQAGTDLAPSNPVQIPQTRTPINVR